MSSRRAAVDVLIAVERGSTTLAAELARVRPHVGDERDRALLVELTAGTLRWRAQLDALLAQCSRRPMAQLSAATRAILRVSAYQLEHLERVPAHAALHEAVELTRALKEPRAAGFVNAVLRTWLRTRPALKLPERPAATAGRGPQLAYLSITLSHPEWLAARWLDRHGFEAVEQRCRFNNTVPDITVRAIGSSTATAMLDRLRTAGIDAQPARFVRDAISLPPGGLGRIPASLIDEFLPQDEASQIVARVVGATPGQRVLDLCASPGAKTLVLAADLHGEGRLVAADFRASRVRLLRQTLRRGRAPAHVVALDATRPLPFGPVFDRVFVDAPCSGLGIIRRDPDLKWSRQEGELAGLALAQQRMLANAAEAVARGGRLIYATCSSEPEENDAVVDAFLARDRRFAPAPVAFAPQVTGADKLIEPGGRLRMLPFRDGMDAFFAAVLTRT